MAWDLLDRAPPLGDGVGLRTDSNIRSVRSPNYVPQLPSSNANVYPAQYWFYLTR
jgi:hypothetical protein